MSTIIRTLFWRNGTICVVKFNPNEILGRHDLCKALGKSENECVRDEPGNCPTRYLRHSKFWWEDNPLFDTSDHLRFPVLDLDYVPTMEYDTYFMEGFTASNIKSVQQHEETHKQLTPPKKANIKIHWLNEGAEVIEGEEHNDPYKTIISALYNGGYSQAAMKAIKYWSINDSCIRYTLNTETYKWEASQ